MQDSLEIILQGRKFKRAVEHQFAELRNTRDLKQVDIEILIYVSRFPQVTSTDLHQTLQLNKGHISQSTDRLCRKGFLMSAQDPADRRYVRYSLTSQGAEIVDACAEIRDRFIAVLLQGLSEQDLKELGRLSRILLRNIDQLEEL